MCAKWLSLSVDGWESHYGFGVRMGHGVPTLFARDPDSLGNDVTNNLRMIDQTIYHMLEICSLRGRPVEGELDPDRAIVRIFSTCASSTSRLIAPSVNSSGCN